MSANMQEIAYCPASCLVLKSAYIFDPPLNFASGKNKNRTLKIHTQIIKFFYFGFFDAEICFSWQWKTSFGVELISKQPESRRKEEKRDYCNLSRL